MSEMKKKKISWPLTVKTKRLELRPLRLSDYLSWKKGVTQKLPLGRKFDMPAVPLSKASKTHFKKIVAKESKGAKADQGYHFHLFEKETGHHLGVVDFSTHVRGQLQWANLGYELHNNYHGKGYAQEAVKALLKVGHKKLGYKRIEACTNVENKKSLRLLKKLGMKKECRRRHFYFQFGTWNDNWIFVSIDH